MTLQDTIDINSASRIARARAAIDAGTYDTPVVAAITAERAIDEIVGRQISDDENTAMDAINVTCIEG